MHDDSPDYWTASAVALDPDLDITQDPEASLPDLPEAGEDPSAFPAPEHTSRDPFPEDQEIPSAVLAMRKLAESAGWAVGLTYSRGWKTHAGTGKPTTLAHMLALRMFHPGTRMRAVAFYATPTAKRDWKWDGILLTGPGVMAPYASQADLKDYLLDRGLVPDGWHAEVRRRHVIAAGKKKAKCEPCSLALDAGKRVPRSCPVCVSMKKKSTGKHREHA